MRKFIFGILFFILSTSFLTRDFSQDQFQIFLEAKGCHYQISVNDQLVDEGKSYQTIKKTLSIDTYLSGSGEQKVQISMKRISREIPLKTTNASIKLGLQENTSDSVHVIKLLNMPTFPYDDDEIQPQSIGEFIYFEK